MMWTYLSDHQPLQEVEVPVSQRSQEKGAKHPGPACPLVVKLGVFLPHYQLGYHISHPEQNYEEEGGGFWSGWHSVYS